MSNVFDSQSSLVSWMRFDFYNKKKTTTRRSIKSMECNSFSSLSWPMMIHGILFTWRERKKTTTMEISLHIKILEVIRLFVFFFLNQSRRCKIREMYIFFSLSNPFSWKQTVQVSQSSWTSIYESCLINAMLLWRFLWWFFSFIWDN